MDLVHYDITVHGRVQGVSFRVYTKNKAQDLKLCGIVKNKLDGTVYIEAEGLEDVVQQLIEWCYTGSPHSKVEKVDIARGKMTGYRNFEIKY
ncbi:MAG: acylphosphatase [Cytophagales bacterium]|nr:acylphosphatase [Cytophagales bacterium]